MSRDRNTLANFWLIISGAGLSTLFISTSGNGRDPLPVAGDMLMVVAIVGVVSFALAWPVRAMPLAIVGSVVITELGFLLYFVGRVAYSEHVHEHVYEELCLLPLVFAVVTAPTILLSAIGFGRMAQRVYRRESPERVDGKETDSLSAPPGSSL